MWLKQIFVGQFAGIRREERPKALLMSAFFFLVIALVSLAMVAVRWLSFITFAILMVWVFQIRLADRVYREKAKAESPGSVTATR